MKIGLTPLDLELDRRIVLVDMRPREERTSELGFLPGSLVLPLGRDLRRFAEQMAHLSSEGPIALTCVSGRRSGEAIAALAPLIGPIQHLEGGLLAWGASGFPLCYPEPDPRASFLGSGELRSSFLAELAHLSVEQDRHLDLLSIYSRLYQAVGLEPPVRGAKVASSVMRDLVDRAASVLRGFGADCERIVHFVEPLYASTLGPDAL